jgi:pimeloyl-ACP methyl ester carboxylesterase
MRDMKRRVGGSVLASAPGMHDLGRTPAFRGTDGEPVSGSIAEVKWVNLGGLDQWVMIRGENITNPVLLLLHGGPGMSETSLFRGFNSALERSYTVVYWDQRGAGKSFDPGTPRSSMTVEQFLVDLDQLVDHVRKRVGKTKVTLLGHSWGSQLGCLYAARHPEKVAVYVGCAQIGDSKRSEAASYAIAVDAARRAGNRKAERELLAIGAPPHDGKSLWIERMWLNRLDGAMSPKALWKLGRVLLTDKEHSIFEAFSTFRALRWTIDAMWREVSELSLPELVPALQMPTFFMLGRKDHWVPAEVSVEYIDALSAPTKQLIWFDESGHEIFVDEAEKFNETMLELVLPVARARDV